jgi:hypothetical protein
MRSTHYLPKKPHKLLLLFSIFAGVKLFFSHPKKAKRKSCKTFLFPFQLFSKKKKNLMKKKINFVVLIYVSFLHSD